MEPLGTPLQAPLPPKVESKNVYNNLITKNFGEWEKFKVKISKPIEDQKYLFKAMLDIPDQEFEKMIQSPGVGLAILNWSQNNQKLSDLFQVMDHVSSYKTLVGELKRNSFGKQLFDLSQAPGNVSVRADGHLYNVIDTQKMEWLKLLQSAGNSLEKSWSQIASDINGLQDKVVFLDKAFPKEHGIYLLDWARRNGQLKELTDKISTPGIGLSNVAKELKEKGPFTKLFTTHVDAPEYDSLIKKNADEWVNISKQISGMIEDQKYLFKTMLGIPDLTFEAMTRSYTQEVGEAMLQWAQDHQKLGEVFQILDVVGQAGVILRLKKSSKLANELFSIPHPSFQNATTSAEGHPYDIIGSKKMEWAKFLRDRGIEINERWNSIVPSTPFKEMERKYKFLEKTLRGEQGIYILEWARKNGKLKELADFISQEWMSMAGAARRLKTDPTFGKLFTTAVDSPPPAPKEIIKAVEIDPQQTIEELRKHIQKLEAENKALKDKVAELEKNKK